LHLLDFVPTSHVAGVVHAEDVTLSLESRRAVSAPAHVAVGANLVTVGGLRRYRVDLPDAARGWERVDLVQATTLGATPPLAGPPTRVTLGPDVVPSLLASFIGTMPEHVMVDVFGAAPPEAHDVETDAFVVPEDGVLEVGVGVSVPAIRPPGDVPLRIAAWDGSREREVWQGQVPASRTTWQDVRVPLAALAGRRVRLRFSTRPGPLASMGALGVFGEPIVTTPRRGPGPPVHVVLISLDTLRARSVGAYGAERPTTPALDALAADGALFENAFSTAAFTLPGHMSMFTGLWFRTHRAFGFFSVLPLEHRTIPELLQGAGYATLAATSGSWIIPGLGFRRSFDVYYERGPVTPAEARTALPHMNFTRGLASLRENPDRPQLLFLHNYQAHAPYLAPKSYVPLVGGLAAGAPDEEQRRLAYEAAIRYVDDQLGAFLDGLDALGIRDRTLVIVTADHGEAFLEHGIVEHTHDVHDEIARVPLVVRLPGLTRPGTHIVEPVSLADLAPTIADVVGLAPMAAVDGTSLVPLLVGATERLDRPGVFTEAESEPNLGWTDLSAVHTRTVSCIHDARRDVQRCWDRRRDPWQMGDPLPANDASTEVATATAALATFRTAHPPPGAPAPADAAATAIDPERREQLRALGYVE
jgi:arylsulfatase A-like enzyme